MADSKKSDIFGDKKPTVEQARQEKRDLAEERRTDAAHIQHNKNVEAHKTSDTKANLESHTFTANKDRVYTRTYPSGKVPVGQWGLAVWTRDANPTESPAFLDNQGDWWWATTTNQNGVNPAVEKTEEPVGWRTI